MLYKKQCILALISIITLHTTTYTADTYSTPYDTDTEIITSYELDEKIMTLIQKTNVLLQDISIKASSYKYDAHCASLVTSVNIIKNALKTAQTRASFNTPHQLYALDNAYAQLAQAFSVEYTITELHRSEETTEKLYALYQKLEAQCVVLQTIVTNLKASTLSSCLKTIVQTGQKLHVDTIAQRSWPYLLLGAWWIHITKLNDIKKYNSSTLTWLKEHVIGGLEKKSPNLTLNLNITPGTEFSEEDVNKIALQLNKLTKNSDIALTTTSMNHRNGFFGTIFDKFSFIGEDMKSTLINIAIPVLVFPYLKKDAENAYAYISSHVQKLYHALVDEPATLAQPDVTALTQKLLSDSERRSEIKQALRSCCFTAEFPELLYLCKETEGCSQQELARIFSQALAYAQAEDRAISYEDITKSIDKVVYGIAVEQEIRQSHATEMLCVELAGSALVSELLQPYRSITKITLQKITPAIKTPTALLAPGIFIADAHSLMPINEYAELQKMCKITLAGVLAQQVIYGYPTYVALEEAQNKAFDIAYKLVLNGIDDRLLPRSIAEEKMAEAWNVVKAQAEETLQLIVTHKETLIEIIELLKEKFSVAGGQISALVAATRNAETEQL